MNKEFNPDAILCLSSSTRIAIELNRTGEVVRYQWCNCRPSRWCKIYYNQKGEPYFKARRRRFYLSQFHFAIIPPYNSALKFNRYDHNAYDK